MLCACQERNYLLVANKLAQRGKVMSSFSHDLLVYANMGKKKYVVCSLADPVLKIGVG